ncbi:MAG: DUF5020 family protein [Paludibacteraceae bacterium]|nr:DUF5020 family protein [Paludibacteraceae bacterium]MBR6520521.1 DUF5020 family protein [Paludibacteraceae bacterium]
MKKITSLFIIALIAMQITNIKAQNLQVMYDFERGCVTSTVEMFRPDAGGSTYFFIDMDCAPKMTGAYWEIAREFNFWQNTKLSWLSAHIEYNGGLNTSAMSFNNCWLGGITYSGHSKDFTKTWSLSALYKVIPGTVGLSGKSDIHNFQITGVWGIEFAKGWCTFSGFFDFWREARIWQGTEYIFITEPQFWVNFNKIKGCDKVNLSLGGEVEVSANFVDKGFHVLPAVGAKWTF